MGELKLEYGEAKNPNRGFFCCCRLFCFGTVAKEPRGKEALMSEREFLSFLLKRMVPPPIPLSKSAISCAGCHAFGLQATKPADWSQSVEHSDVPN